MLSTNFIIIHTHDSTVFRESLLGIKLKEYNLDLPQPSVLPGFNFEMPYVIVGDNAFPLHVNLILIKIISRTWLGTRQANI